MSRYRHRTISENHELPYKSQVHSDSNCSENLYQITYHSLSLPREDRRTRSSNYNYPDMKPMNHHNSQMAQTSNEHFSNLYVKPLTKHDLINKSNQFLFSSQDQLRDSELDLNNNLIRKDIRKKDRSSTSSEKREKKSKKSRKTIDINYHSIPERNSSLPKNQQLIISTESSSNNNPIDNNFGNSKSRTSDTSQPVQPIEQPFQNPYESVNSTYVASQSNNPNNSSSIAPQKKNLEFNKSITPKGLNDSGFSNGSNYPPQQPGKIQNTAINPNLISSNPTSTAVAAERRKVNHSFLQATNNLNKNNSISNSISSASPNSSNPASNLVNPSSQDAKQAQNLNQHQNSHPHAALNSSQANQTSQTMLNKAVNNNNQRYHNHHHSNQMNHAVTNNTPGNAAHMQPNQVQNANPNSLKNTRNSFRQAVHQNHSTSTTQNLSNHVIPGPIQKQNSHKHSSVAKKSIKKLEKMNEDKYYELYEQQLRNLHKDDNSSSDRNSFAYQNQNNTLSLLPNHTMPTNSTPGNAPVNLSQHHQNLVNQQQESFKNSPRSISSSHEQSQAYSRSNAGLDKNSNVGSVASAFVVSRTKKVYDQNGNLIETSNGKIISQTQKERPKSVSQLEYEQYNQHANTLKLGPSAASLNAKLLLNSSQTSINMLYGSNASTVNLAGQYSQRSNTALKNYANLQKQKRGGSKLQGFVRKGLWYKIFNLLFVEWMRISDRKTPCL